MKSLTVPKILPLAYPPPIPALHTRTGTSVNRIVRMVANTVVGPQQRMDFAYDHQGRRITNRVWNNTAGTGTSGLDQKVPYDGWNLFAVLGADNSLLPSFVWGTDLSGTFQGAGGVGGLLWIHALSTLNNQPSTHFVAHDGNGNMSLLINATDGTDSACYEYAPFGEVNRETGAMVNACSIRFSIKYQDDEIDLVYYGYLYCNPSTGRWLSRVPFTERGGMNLFSFPQNDPITAIDFFGLAYQISNLPPTGWWMLVLRDVPYKGETYTGFAPRYLPTYGRYEHPVCPCKKENIFLAQVVKDPMVRIPQFDVLKTPNTPNDPIPPYDGSTEPLTIIHAPHFSKIKPVIDTTWHFEDRAVCRTRPDEHLVDDKVLGCIRFDFTRNTNGTVSITVFINGAGHESQSLYIAEAQSPTKLWDEGLNNWIKQGTK